MQEYEQRIKELRAQHDAHLSQCDGIRDAGRPPFADQLRDLANSRCVCVCPCLCMGVLCGLSVFRSVYCQFLGLILLKKFLSLY